MPFYRQFSSIFEAGDEWDRISALPRTCASMLFFRYNNGSYGGGPFFVWSSDEGEAFQIARSMPITGVARADMPLRVLTRNAVANWRAAARRNHHGYRVRGHSEEFMVQDFATCLGIVGGHNVDKAIMSITWSPCIGGLDNTASTNFGVVRGCYNKLILLAAKHHPLRFEVSFKVPFGHFSGNGGAAVAYMNANRISDNIEFEFAPATG